MQRLESLELTPKARIEAVGASWAAFSPLSGETLILNDEAAAILEVLQAGAADERAIATQLSADTAELSPADLQGLVRGAVMSLEAAGLVLRRPAPPPGHDMLAG